MTAIIAGKMKIPALTSVILPTNLTRPIKAITEKITAKILHAFIYFYLYKSPDLSLAFNFAKFEFTEISPTAAALHHPA